VAQNAKSLVATHGSSERPVLEQRAQHRDADCTDEQVAIFRVNDWERGMPTALENIDDRPDLLHWTEEDHVLTHDVTGKEVAVLRSGSQLSLEELHSSLQVDVDVVQVVVEEATHQPRRHQGQHQWQHVLLIPGALE